MSRERSSVVLRGKISEGRATLSIQGGGGGTQRAKAGANRFAAGGRVFLFLGGGRRAMGGFEEVD
jgi:hypothetical protein